MKNLGGLGTDCLRLSLPHGVVVEVCYGRVTGGASHFCSDVLVVQMPVRLPWVLQDQDLIIVKAEPSLLYTLVLSVVILPFWHT